MSTTIRISSEVEKYFERHGKFGETHNDVLVRRLIEFNPDATPNAPNVKLIKKKRKKRETRKGLKRKRSDPSLHHTQTELIPYLLKVLLNSKNYKLSVLDAINEVGKLLTFRENDHKIYQKNEIRWKNSIKWARQRCVQDKLIHLKEVSGRGYWQLTKAGIIVAKKICL